MSNCSVYNTGTHELVDFVILLELFLHSLFELATNLVALNVDVLNVMISFYCLHKFLHFNVADGIVVQIDMLNAREFSDKLCQEVELLKTLAFK